MIVTRRLVLLCLCSGFTNAENKFQHLGCGFTTNAKPKIVGGEDSEIEDSPWQVALEVLYNGRWRFACGGALIAPSWVLTAAHCTEEPAWKYRVVVGTTRYNASVDDELKHKVKDIYEYPSYCFGMALYADVALLELEEAVDLETTKARTICLPDPAVDWTGEDCIISGWGRTKEDVRENPLILQSATVTIGDMEFCRTINPAAKESLHICAGNHTQGGVSSCYGDSGGALACQQSDGQWSVVGVTSFGRDCDKGTVYARVSTHNTWITDVIAGRYSQVSVLEDEVVPPISQFQTVNFTCRPRDNQSAADNITWGDHSTLNSTQDATEETRANITWYMNDGEEYSELASGPKWWYRARIGKSVETIMCEDDLGVVAEWNLTVVVPAEHMECATSDVFNNIDNYDLLVNCTLRNVLPSSQRECHLIVYSEETGKSTSHYTELKHWPTMEFYYRRCNGLFSCDFRLQGNTTSSGLGPGRNALNVTLFSTNVQIRENLSGRNVTESTPDLILAMPESSMNCPFGDQDSVAGSYVWLESSHNAICDCGVKDKGETVFTPGQPHLTITEGGTTRNVSLGHKIKPNSHANDQLFECLVTSHYYPGYKSQSVYKTVRFAYGPDNSTVVSLSSPDVTSSQSVHYKCSLSPINMTCHVTGVKPQPELVVSMRPPGRNVGVRCASPGVCTYSFLPVSTGVHTFECVVWNSIFHNLPTPHSTSVQVTVSENRPDTVPVLLLDGHSYRGADNSIMAALTSRRSVDIGCSLEGASHTDVIILCVGVKVTGGKFTPRSSDDGKICQCYLDLGDCRKVMTNVILTVQEDQDNQSNNNSNTDVIIGVTLAGSLAFLAAILAFLWFKRG